VSTAPRLVELVAQTRRVSSLGCAAEDVEIGKRQRPAAQFHVHSGPSQTPHMNSTALVFLTATDPSSFPKNDPRRGRMPAQISLCDTLLPRKAAAATCPELRTYR
jgi:hypothetical protein